MKMFEVSCRLSAEILWYISTSFAYHTPPTARLTCASRNIIEFRNSKLDSMTRYTYRNFQLAAAL